ncbi:PKD domain-containing protein [Terrimonas pollutisoli]|uniref:PKD domain-containing protein n=1 Tax=Terrimonas pollutisoli TaxID=3034147 RepID=UPI0023EB7FAB|nr:PKD domain-containing protein [Terrimonas sp. H1YJ31]
MSHLIAFFKGRTAPVFFLLAAFPAFSQAQLTANFSMDKSGGCSPLSVSFSNQSFGASANAIFRWDFGNGNTSALPNPGAIYTEEKEYTVTLTVTDGNQTSSKTATITVYKKPTVDFTATAPKVCIPAAVSFNANVTAGDGYISNYSWDFGDGQTQQGYGQTMTHYYSYQQKPAVNLTVTNSYGCYNTVTKTNTIEILGRIEPVFTTDKNLLCSLDQTLQLTNSSTGPGSLLYKWNFGDGTSSTQKNPVHQFTKKGVYPVTLTVSNTDGCSATSYPVSVNAAYFNTDFNVRPLCRELSFTSSSYLYPNNSLWKFGDGNSVNSYSGASHIYANPGTYDVTLINTYETCKDSVTKTVKVEDQVKFNSSIEVPGLLCKAGNSIFKSKSDTPPGSSYWEFGDGSTNNWWTEVNHAYAEAGTYTIKLTNTFGTCKETVTKQIVVNDLPDLKGFVVDYGGVCGSPVNIKFKDTTAGAVKWQWRLDYFSNTNFSTQQNASYNFTYDGYYWVYLTVANAAGCSSNISRQVNVFKPSVNISLLSSSSFRWNYDCDSLKVKLGANGNQVIKTYNWSFGDGTTSADATPEHTYHKEGAYTITLNYTTESGCQGTTTYSVRVYGKAKADFIYSIPCGNSLDLQFSDKSNFADRWEWNFGDNGFAFYQTPYHTYRDTGKYNVQFISHIGHCSDTIVKQVYANVLPSFVTITKVENTCEGTRGTVSFDQRSLRISSGTWNFGDGTTIPYDTSVHLVKHTYTKTGTYQVTLTGVSGNCTLTSTQQVTILLKQNPVLTGNKTEICSNDNLTVKITGVETNPHTGNWEYGQYYVSKFEHNTGAIYNGYIYDYFKYTTFNGTLQNFKAGTTSMRAIITAANTGCTDTTSYISLKVNGPIAGFKIAANDICYKSSFVFEDTSKTSTNTPLKTWQWDFGDGEYATYTSSAKVTHLYKTPGNYTVRLTVTDASGCQSAFSYTVNAKGPKAAFTASGLYVPNVPLNTNVTFYNNTISWYSNSVNYKWLYGDGANSNEYWGEHTYTKAGTNTVKLIANDPSISCADTAIQVITVKDFNTAFSFTTNYLTNNSCPPVVVRINNLSVGFTSLKWDFGDGTTSSDQYYPSHVYDKPGTYRITLYTYGYNGLTGTYKDSVTISEPSAKISADILKGCTSQQVTLSADVKNTTKYTWDFGDGTINNNATASSVHKYLTPGVYQPKLIVKDAGGCTATSTLPEKIIIDSLFIAIKGIPAQICDSTKIFFTPDVRSVAADQAGVPLIYHWDFGTGNAEDTSNIKNAIFNFNKPGTYTVKFKVTSPFGCVKEVSEKVTVYKKAKAGITGIGELCAGGSVLFKGNASMSPVDWAWNFNNGNTSNAQNPAAQTFDQAAVYNVQLVVKYNGCYDTTTHQLVVHPNPVTNVSAVKNQLCRGETIQLSATGGDTFLWQSATGLTSATIGSPLASPIQTTKYVVDVTNGFGCTKRDSILLTVVQPFNMVMATDTFVCSGSNVQLNVRGANSYQWINSVTGLNNTQIPNPVASPVVNTVYTVVGSDAYNCFKDTLSVNVAVRPLPAVTAEPDFQMLAAETHQLRATASNDVVKWLWSPADYLSCASCPSPIAQPRRPMDYIVTVKNQYGCQASDTVGVRLECADNFVFIPTSFTPNNDGKNDVFYIKGKGIGIIKSLIIYNRWGEMVFEKRNFGIDDRSNGWDGKNKGLLVPTGAYIYFAEMECDSRAPIIKKGTVTVVY